MDSPNDPPGPGFWVTNVIVITISIFVVFLWGAGPGNGGGSAADLRMAFGLALIPGCCVGLYHAFFLEHISKFERLKWFGVTAASSGIGWGIVMVLAVLLEQLNLSLSVSSELVPALVTGSLTGGLAGIITGVVVGLAQGLLQPHFAKRWLVGSILCWGTGAAIPLATILGLLSQMDLLPLF